MRYLVSKKWESHFWIRLVQVVAMRLGGNCHSSRVKLTALLEKYSKGSCLPCWDPVYKVSVSSLCGCETQPREDWVSLELYTLGLELPNILWKILILKITCSLKFRFNKVGVVLFVVFYSISQLYLWFLCLCQKCWVDHKNRERHSLPWTLWIPIWIHQLFIYSYIIDRNNDYLPGSGSMVGSEQDLWMFTPRVYSL